MRKTNREMLTKILIFIPWLCLLCSFMTEYVRKQRTVSYSVSLIQKYVTHLASNSCLLQNLHCKSRETWKTLMERTGIKKVCWILCRFSSVSRSWWAFVSLENPLVFEFYPNSRERERDRQFEPRVHFKQVYYQCSFYSLSCVTWNMMMREQRRIEETVVSFVE